MLLPRIARRASRLEIVHIQAKVRPELGWNLMIHGRGHSAHALHANLTEAVTQQTSLTDHLPCLAVVERLGTGLLLPVVALRLDFFSSSLEIVPRTRR